ncbi:MAG: hypothetical protein JO045_27015 [Mycobacterium sp.]|nr:hypothetical protein [Mycobacterium sp.]
MASSLLARGDEPGIAVLSAGLRWSTVAAWVLTMNSWGLFTRTSSGLDLSAIQFTMCTSDGPDSGVY